MPAISGITRPAGGNAVHEHAWRAGFHAWSSMTTEAMSRDGITHANQRVAIHEHVG